MKLSRRIMALVLAVITVAGAFAFASCAQGNPAEDNTKIKIGLTGPLTGDASIYGIAVKNSAELAIKEINAAGGLKIGDKSYLYDFKMHDDKHDPTTVASLYADLYEKGMQVSLGTVTTKPGLEFATLSKDDNVFFITPSATGDDIPANSNGFQMCFADSNQGTAAAKFFNENYKGKKIGVFYKSDDEYSKGIYDNFKKNLDKSFDISNTTASFQGKATTFDSQIQLLKECEIVFMPIYYTPASQFMIQANGVQNSISVYYGCDGFDGIDAIKGFDVNSIPQEISYLSHFVSTAADGTAAKAYIDKYVAEYGADAPINQFGASAYDCVYAIHAALQKAVADGEDIAVNMSASDMCDILTKIFTSSDSKFRGVTGAEGTDITWSKDGTVQKEALKYQVKPNTAA